MLQHIRHDGNNMTQLCQLKAQWLSASLRGLEVHVHAPVLGHAWLIHARAAVGQQLGGLSGWRRAGGPTSLLLLVVVEHRKAST